MKSFSTLPITLVVLIAFVKEKYRAKYLLVEFDDVNGRGKLCIYCDQGGNITHQFNSYII